MDNEGLKDKYNEMHAQGQSAWFDSGDIERKAILEMGEPWNGLKVLEIGCGEGELAHIIASHHKMEVHGIDYSDEAIRKARFHRYSKAGRGLSLSIMPEIGINLAFATCGYQDIKQTYDRIVMQGVLEHLDDPFTELKWMIDNLLNPKGDIITSSPGFLNLRGIIWMTLNMVGAVMSKTDLHYLNEWDFKLFCDKHRYKITRKSVDFDWAGGNKMYDDLEQRIPLALKDGNIPYDLKKFNEFLDWLYLSKSLIEISDKYGGATNIYRIDA